MFKQHNSINKQSKPSIKVFKNKNIFNTLKI